MLCEWCIWENVCWMVVGYIRHYICIGIEWLRKSTEPSISTVQIRSGDFNEYEARPVNTGGPWPPDLNRVQFKEIFSADIGTWTSAPPTVIAFLWQPLGGGRDWTEVFVIQVFTGTKNCGLITVWWDLCDLVNAEEINATSTLCSNVHGHASQLSVLLSTMIPLESDYTLIPF